MPVLHDLVEFLRFANRFEIGIVPNHVSVWKPSFDHPSQRIESGSLELRGQVWFVGKAVHRAQVEAYRVIQPTEVLFVPNA